jgi:hypothetical protein
MPGQPHRLHSATSQAQGEYVLLFFFTCQTSNFQMNQEQSAHMRTSALSSVRHTAAIRSAGQQSSWLKARDFTDPRTTCRQHIQKDLSTHRGGHGMSSMIEHDVVFDGRCAVVMRSAGAGSGHQVGLRGERRVEPHDIVPATLAKGTYSMACGSVPEVVGIVRHCCSVTLGATWAVDAQAVSLQSADNAESNKEQTKCVSDISICNVSRMQAFDGDAAR